MPEMPEVETIRRSLEATVHGRAYREDEDPVAAHLHGRAEAPPHGRGGTSNESDPPLREGADHRSRRQMASVDPFEDDRSDRGPPAKATRRLRWTSNGRYRRSHAERVDASGAHLECPPGLVRERPTQVRAHSGSDHHGSDHRSIAVPYGSRAAGRRFQPRGIQTADDPAPIGASQGGTARSNDRCGHRQHLCR